ncbi:hypothetical protein RJ640_026335 [Escallonia rubra]|uniref:MSP domain-containing protein n=1 Tax=Escallonia rubra TaxID=112253 RepID=A0AA88R5F8_9ASTE|nr:hypothetical protein RJ640_026335 [Escallonia rubra]
MFLHIRPENVCAATICTSYSAALLFAVKPVTHLSFLSLTTRMERLVEVTDQEVRIDFLLGCKCRATVRLRSLSATAPIAFKVQTSSPHKFLVNPPSGLIPPLSHSTFQVILRPQSQLPQTFPRSPSDRFLLRVALAPELALTQNAPDSSQSDRVNSWFNSVPDRPTHDIKLKVAYVGTFLLRHAVKTGDCDAVRSMIKRKRSILTELTTREAELLLGAANESDNSEDMISLLLDAGLKVERLGDARESRWATKGWTELHAAAAGDRAGEVSRLVKGGSLDCRDKEGRTPLHLAASKGHEGCVRLLAGAGADVDARSKDGRTALYRAAANGDRRMVELMVEWGADPTITAADRGRSALDVARDKGHKEVIEILERGEEVLNAARRGELRRLELLLEKDASVDYRDQYGLTALHAAAIKGHKEAVMLLVEFGSDVECLDAEGHTPLHLAVEGGSTETVEVLVDRGANVNAKSNKGATPLHIATQMGYEDISRFLRGEGAAASSLPSSSSLSSIL